MATAGGTDDRREGTDDCLEWRHLMRGSASATITARVGRGLREIKSAFCGETTTGRIFVAGHVSRRGSSTGTWHLFKVVSEILPGFQLRPTYSEGFVHKSLETGDETINWLKSTHKNDSILSFISLMLNISSAVVFHTDISSDAPGRYFTYVIFLCTFCIGCFSWFWNEEWELTKPFGHLSFLKKTKHLNLTLKSYNDLGDWEPSWTQWTRLVCPVFLSQFCFFFCLLQ